MTDATNGPGREPDRPDCPNWKTPAACYRVRCQLGDECFGRRDMRAAAPPAAPPELDHEHPPGMILCRVCDDRQSNAPPEPAPAPDADALAVEAWMVEWRRRPHSDLPLVELTRDCPSPSVQRDAASITPLCSIEDARALIEQQARELAAARHIAAETDLVWRICRKGQNEANARAERAEDDLAAARAVIAAADAQILAMANELLALRGSFPAKEHEHFYDAARAAIKETK